MSADTSTTIPPKPGIIPTILSPDSDKHIAWIKNVFKAQQQEIYRTKDEKNVMHCSLVINGGYLYLCDQETSMEKKGMKEGEEEESEIGGVVLHVELEDPSTFWASAMSNGASVIEDLRQQYWGGLYGSVRDPFGFVWGLMKGGDCRKPGVVPYFNLEEGTCEAYLEWLTEAFGGEVKDRFSSPDSKLLQHCTMEINGGNIYLADEIKMVGQKKISHGLKSNIICHMDLPDPRATWEKAIQNGGQSVVELKVQFWGDLYGTLKDTAGFQWSMCEKTSPSPSSCNKVRGVISYIASSDCDKHIEWIKKVLDGKVKGNIVRTESGRVMHCDMSVNGGTLMISDRLVSSGDPLSQGSSAVVGPPTTPPSPHRDDQTGFTLHLNVADPDPLWKKALENGGIQVVELKKQFWGDYYGMFQDPFGYRWSVLKC